MNHIQREALRAVNRANTNAYREGRRWRNTPHLSGALNAARLRIK